MFATNFTTAFATVLALAQAAILTAAVAAPAPAADPARPTINVSDSVVTLGTTVTVSGTIPDPLRWVSLQVETADNGWQEVDRQLNVLSSHYSLTAPGWYGTHRLRVYAGATLLAPAAVSDVRTVTVQTAYAPTGKSSEWTWTSDRRARWDSCSTITYRINPTGGYRQATADLASAFRKVAAVTGFRFHYLGTTDSKVERGEPAHYPSDTDVLIDWQNPREEPGLSGAVAGIGGHWVLNGRRYDGYVILDKSQRLDRATWQKSMMHELGHVVGLGHTESRWQVMYGGAASATNRWGAGDLAGLRHLGASRGCLD